MSIKKLKLYEENFELRPTIETEEEDLSLRPEDIYDFVGDVDAFGNRSVELNGKWGIINKEEEVIVEPKYQYMSTPNFLGDRVLHLNGRRGVSDILGNITWFEER